MVQRIEEKPISFFQIVGRPGGGKTIITSELIAKLESQLPQDGSVKILRLNVDDYLLPRDKRPTTEEQPTVILDLSTQEHTTSIGWKFRQVSEGEIEINTPVGNFTHKFHFPGESFHLPLLIPNAPSISIEYEGNGRYLWRMPPFLSKISWELYGDILKILNGEVVLKPIYEKRLGGPLRVNFSDELILDPSKRVGDWIYWPQKSEEMKREIYVNPETGEVRELLAPGEKKTVLVAEGVWLGLIPQITQINNVCDGILAISTPTQLIHHWLGERIILAEESIRKETVPERMGRQTTGWSIYQEQFTEPVINNVRAMTVDNPEMVGAVVYITDPVSERSEQAKALSSLYITGEVLDLEQRIFIAWDRYQLDTKIREKALNPFEFLENYMLPLLPLNTPLYRCVRKIAEFSETGNDINELFNFEEFKALSLYERAILLGMLSNLRQKIEVPLHSIEDLLQYTPPDSALHKFVQELKESIGQGEKIEDFFKRSRFFGNLTPSEKEIVYRVLPQLPFLSFSPPAVEFSFEIPEHPELSREITDVINSIDLPYELLYIAKQKGIENWLTSYIERRYEEEEEISAIVDEIKNTFISTTSVLYLWEKLQEYSGDKVKEVEHPNIAVLGCGDLSAWGPLYFAANAKELDGIEREIEFQSDAEDYIQEYFPEEERDKVHWINGNMTTLTKIAEIEGKQYHYIFVRVPFYIKDFYNTLVQAKEFLTEEGRIVLFIRERDFVTKERVTTLIEEGVGEIRLMEFDTYSLTERSTERSERCVVLNKKELEKLIKFFEKWRR
ncbi:MAG TPA: hypothetical protein ENF60_02210 [Candidatus Omnitrophica bacterium]|nr:hypothetical protein [Candidatus Omnitrophota bacterium]